MVEPRDALLSMLREHAFKQGDFTLKSGKKSDFLIDCKNVVLSARGHHLVGEVLLTSLQTFGCTAVAGVELGGCPLASAVASASARTLKHIDAIYVRKEAKAHGSKSLLEGAGLLARSSRVVVVEDVTTTGGSALAATVHLWKYGFDVVGVCSLVDRLEGGREAIEKEKLRFWSVFDRHDFIVKEPHGREELAPGADEEP